MVTLRLKTSDGEHEVKLPTDDSVQEDVYSGLYAVMGDEPEVEETDNGEIWFANTSQTYLRAVQIMEEETGCSFPFLWPEEVVDDSPLLPFYERYPDAPRDYRKAEEECRIEDFAEALKQPEKYTSFCIEGGEVPAEIGLFQNLEQLYNRWSKVGTLPKEIGYLKNLDYLSFTDAGIRSLPHTVKELVSLKDCDLSSNPLASFPEELVLLPIEELNLSSCYLGSLPESIGQMKELRKLTIRENELQKLPESLVDCRNLARIEMLHNRELDTKQCFTLFASMPSLKKVRLNTPNISTEIPSNPYLEKLSCRASYVYQGEPNISWLEKLPNLKELDLSFQGFSMVPEELSRCTELTALEISSNQELSLPDSLGKLKNLRRLSIGSGCFRELPAWLFELKELESLSVGYNGVCSREGILNLLEVLPKLTSLSISGTPASLDPDFVEKIKELYPDLYLSCGSSDTDQFRNTGDEGVALLKELVEKEVIPESKAREILGIIGGDTAFDWLCELMSDVDAKFGDGSFSSLLLLDEKRALDIILRFFTSQEEGNKKKALEYVSYCPGDGIAKKVVQLFREKPDEYSSYGSPSLGRLASPATPEIVEDLIYFFEHTKNYQSYYIDALGKIATPEALSFLEKIVDENLKGYQHSALLALRGKHPRVKEAIQACLDKENFRTAFELIQNTEDKTYLPFLKNFLVDSSQNEWERGAAMKVLAVFGDEESQEIIQQYLKDKEYSLSVSACIALFYYDDASCLPIAREHIGTATGDEFDGLLEIVLRFGDERDIYALKQRHGSLYGLKEFLKIRSVLS